MGSRGPAPKPDAQRAGHRAKSERAQTITGFGGVVAPAPDPEWHPRAREVYVAMAESGQVSRWEPSDWAMLLVACDQLSQHYTGSRPSAELFKHTWDILRSLGATDSERRRQGIEVKRSDDSTATPDDDDVTARFAGLRADGDGDD